MAFKAQLKVGWWTQYYIECYIPKYLSYPEVYESARIQWPLLVGTEKSKMAMDLPGYSGHCWWGLRNLRWRPRWPPEINVRGCGI